MLRSCAAVLVASALMAVPGAATAAPPDDLGTRGLIVGLHGGRVAVTSPLTGVVVALDPGHQLGNHRFTDRTGRLVPAGGFRKPCNTTGTATASGYPEATFTFAVARRVASRLRGLGATVVMSRRRNDPNGWGPCVDERGRLGNRVGADLKLSIHADGAGPGGRGFHVIAPAVRKPWTADIHRPSTRLARVTKRALLTSGFGVADYTAGGDGLDRRGDLGTLNLSDVPTVMVELGNMRNLRDARTMTRRHGQGRYARALVQAVRDFLDR